MAPGFDRFVYILLLLLYSEVGVVIITYGILLSMEH